MVNYNMLIIYRKGNELFVTFSKMVIILVWYYKIDRVIIK